MQVCCFFFYATCGHLGSDLRYTRKQVGSEVKSFLNNPATIAHHAGTFDAGVRHSAALKLGNKRDCRFPSSDIVKGVFR